LEISTLAWQQLVTVHGRSSMRALYHRQVAAGRHDFGSIGAYKAGLVEFKKYLSVILMKELTYS
jgi:hypothetical protein